MVNKLFTLSLFLGLISFVVGTACANGDAVLENQIKEVVVEEKLVGITWATILGDDIQVGSAGFANLADSNLMQPSQKMHIGSVAKTVLALGVLRLISEGKLSLETNVETLLPELVFENPWRDIAPIKVKNLLNHTAGLDNIRLWQFLSTTPTPSMPLKHAFPVNNRKLLKIRTEPGRQYSYSNMGYTLLGMVIEAVTQQRYENYLDKYFLTPLGMLDSTFMYVSQQGESADLGLAMGYAENHAALAAIPMYLRPAGQFTTTVTDMTKFMHLILNQGKLNGEPFIRRELMELLASPEGTDAYKAGLNIGRGLAFFFRDRNQVIGACHPGGTVGFGAYLCLYPEEKKGFFYAVNMDNDAWSYKKLNPIFIKHLSVNQAPIVKPSQQLMDISKLEGVFLLSPNNMAQFEYVDKMFNFIRIEPSADKLILKSLQNGDRILEPISERLLRDVDRTQASHVVYTNHEGELFISDGLKTYKKQPFVLILSYWLSLVFGMLGLFYILFVGALRVIIWDKQNLKRIAWPFINMLLFIVPFYFYTKQSFYEFGDITAASVSVAIISGSLPITLLLSLYFCIRGKIRSVWRKLDGVALLMSIQLCLVLFAWDVIPIVFWR